MMATERSPMERLKFQLSGGRNTTSLTDARIRAHMIVAMIDGADKADVEAMARAVGLHLEPKEETND